MSIQEVSAEQLAKLFHHYHHALGPDFGCTTNSTPESWEQVSQPEKNRMVAAARLAIFDIGSGFDSKRTRRPEALFCKAGGGRVGLLAESTSAIVSLDKQKRKVDNAKSRAKPRPAPFAHRQTNYKTTTN